MLSAMESDVREGGRYVNPVYLMSHSGARGGIEQIRQLAGMRGLMAKPTGEIIETPIKANFREGLSVLEYFSSTHGARKGLADTALKTADSGYLTRKAGRRRAERRRHHGRLRHDPGDHQGGCLPRREGRSSLGRLDQRPGQPHVIVNPVTDEVIVAERNDHARDRPPGRVDGAGKDPGPLAYDLRRPAGGLPPCYGMDMSTGSMVEEGMAVGIIAAQSIGEPGTQLTMRTFHIGGSVSKQVEESTSRANGPGRSADPHAGGHQPGRARHRAHAERRNHARRRPRP